MTKATRTNAPPNATELSGTLSRYSVAFPALQRIEAIDDRLATIARELRSLAGLLPRDEIKARLLTWLRGRRARFEGSDKNAFSAHHVLSALSAGREPRLDPLSPEDHLFSLLLWLQDPADLEARALAAVDRLDYAEGPSSAERTRTSAALAREREALVQEREAAVDTCAGAGVEIQHLPETATRRRNEAQRKALAEQQLARQREVARQLDAAK